MKKLVKRVLLCLFICGIFWGAALISDRETLDRELIRLHVVADSDAERDQAIKLQVRDAVLASIRNDLQQVQDVEEARKYLQENLPKLQQIANQVLYSAGVEPNAVATLCKESFPVRVYDTFRLPSGVYETLRITIGSGAGKNWWCVAFPALCIPATTEDFEDAAVGSGFSPDLCDALKQEKPNEIRFFLLDAMGRIKSHLFQN